MSLSGYNTSLLASTVNLKTFVRESETIDNINKKDVRELNFNGDEAKIAYEEIISSGENKKHVSCVKEKFEPKKSETRLREREKRRETRKHSKITANTILKAVENGDMKYLEENVTMLNVNICDDYGWTPLMSAAFCGNYKIIDFLLKLGANTRCRDKSGFTAAGLASKKNYSGIVAILKEKQSIPEIKTARNSSPRKGSEMNDRRNRFYCAICKETFTETTLRKHEASTLHIFNSKPKMPASMYTIPKHNRGYRIMINRGWREEGLGPDEDGLKYPIKTVLKQDRKGLGMETKVRARITHFDSGDVRAIDTTKRQPREKTLKKRDREKMINKEARRERAIRRALS